MISGWRSPLFYIILTLYLLAGVLFATLTPNWQAPDEPAHYNYVRHLATQNSFPELTRRCYNQTYLEQLKSRSFSPELPLDSVCYEFHQPPLYYLLATPVFLLSEGSLLALRLFSVVLGAGVVILAFAIGRTIFPEWTAIAYGTMAFVAFVPMHVAVLASVNNDALAELILAALLLILVRRLLAADQPTARQNIVLGILLGLGLVTKVTVYIAIPLIAAALWLVLTEETKRRSHKGTMRGEEASPFFDHPQGASGSRESWPLRPKRFAFPWGTSSAQAQAEGTQGAREPEEQLSSGAEKAEIGKSHRPSLLWLNRGDWRLLAKQSLIIYGLALAIVLPWYWRNAQLYGNFDLLGLTRHNDVVVGQLRTADFLAQVGRRTYLSSFILTTFHSFWGQFGWMAVPLSERVYLILALFMITVLGGLVGYGIWEVRHRAPWLYGMKDRTGEGEVTERNLTLEHLRPVLILMGLTIGLMMSGYIGYNLGFVQFQGRYLFPALIPLGLFFSLGLHEALSLRWAWWLASGLALALGWLIVVSLLNGDWDKWAVLMISLLLVLAGGRAWLAPRWMVSACWLMAACYMGLALLTLLSPFWYVVPYLSP